MIIDKKKEFNLVLVFGSVPTARGFWNFPILSTFDSLFLRKSELLIWSSSNLLRAADKHRSALPELLLEKYTSRGKLSWRISHLLCSARRLLTPPKSAPRCATSSAMIENPVQKYITQTRICKFLRKLFKRDGF